MKKIIKNNKILIIITITILIFIILLLIKYHNNKTLKNINKSYNKYIIIKKDTNIYNSKKKIIGLIYKGTQLELTTLKKINLKNKYFKIKNTNYYIYYKDIKKIKNIKISKLNPNYITLNRNLKTNKKITLYKNNKKYLTLNKGINLPIEYMDNNNYYVYYLNNILSIKKSKNIMELSNLNSKNQSTNNISVLLYDKIADTCNNNDNCINNMSFIDQINKLKENNYYTITKKEFDLFLSKQLNLKNKAIFIITNNLDDNTKILSKQLNINIDKYDNNKLNINNKPATSLENSKINTYQIKNYSTISNILKIAEGQNIQEKPISKKQEVAVLNYHFFYDPTLGEECNEVICLTTQKFREHINYLKENNFKILTMDEFTKWIYGEIDVPENSVLITIDDGAMGTGKHNGNKLIPILEEYKIPATLFLIAGWWDINNYRSDYLTIQSHTYDMHKYGSCGRGQLVCANYEEAKTDLKKSLDIIGNNTSFCYPFYSYDEEAIQAIKDLGFKIAFAGGNRKATRNSNKYIIPRYPIHADITLEEFKKIVN